MLNAIGLQNPGVDAVVKQILPGLDFSETRFIANACGSTIEEYVEVCRRFDDSPIDAIEINISCPNVKEGGVAFGNYPEASGRVVAACRTATKKPLIAKLSPNQTDIQENARQCIEAGADGLAVINTVMGMAIDVETRRPVLANMQGGLSGPAIRPIALLKTWQVYQVAKTARRAHHRSGRHRHREGCAGVPDRRRDRRRRRHGLVLRSAGVPEDQRRHRRVPGAASHRAARRSRRHPSAAGPGDLGNRLRLSARSRFSNARLRRRPSDSREISPVPRTTRWHGISTAMRLVAQARATARAAVGLPMPAATSA